MTVPLKIKDKLIVCIDSNVFYSAFGYGGNPAKVIELAFARRFYLVLSSHILAEVRENLSKKLEFTDAEIDTFIDNILSIATLYEPVGNTQHINHKKDSLVLETAILGNAHVLVTGDKRDLLPLKTFKGIIIEPPSAFLRRLDEMDV